MYTDAQDWLEAHELIECKPLNGRWTPKTCLEISKRTKNTSPQTKKRLNNLGASRSVPCANCPILAVLEK